MKLNPRHVQYSEGMIHFKEAVEGIMAVHKLSHIEMLSIICIWLQERTGEYLRAERQENKYDNDPATKTIPKEA